jgi:Tfp pilus assembly protein PilN
MIPAGLKQWLAFGSGIGIEVGGARGEEWLNIAAVRVRPSGTRVLGGFMVEQFLKQPAAEWGAVYAAFQKKLALTHAVATVLLPRQDLIVRHISLPGVNDNDLAGAIQFQMDGLHPYNEADVETSWARLPGTSNIVVAIARREVIERYATLFAEAGVRIGCFTASAVAIYSGLRLFGRNPGSEILAWEPTVDGVEIYGETPAKIFSASFPFELERAASLASAELRLEKAAEPKPLGELLGANPALPFAAALSSACPRLSLPLNLLPADRREGSSPLVWVPSAALGLIVLLLAGALAAYPKFADRRYTGTLEAEIAKVQPGALRSANLDRDIQRAQQRLVLLDDWKRRPRQDMDALAEMTKVMPPPTWFNLLELNARQIQVAGETEQAAPLLKVIDASPFFAGSEFMAPPIRVGSQDGKSTAEAFRIRTNREAPQP